MQRNIQKMKHKAKHKKNIILYIEIIIGKYLVGILFVIQIFQDNIVDKYCLALYLPDPKGQRGKVTKGKRDKWTRGQRDKETKRQRDKGTKGQKGQKGLTNWVGRG